MTLSRTGISTTETAAMELFELRYFLAVARHQGVQAGARKIHVSAGSLSKAVAKLEDELGVKLFTRSGGRLTLTAEGRVLEGRAARILSLEESARAELNASAPHLVITGTEMHLACFAADVIAQVERAHADATFELVAATSEEAAIASVLEQRAQAALTAAIPPERTRSRLLGKARFVTCAGAGHPLRARKDMIPIEEVLEHGFVAGDEALVGRVTAGASADGWRDDRFPRRIRYRTSSLDVMRRLVTSGRALAYVPERCAESMNAAPLSIGGCPFHCTQRVSLVLDEEPARGLDALVS